MNRRTLSVLLFAFLLSLSARTQAKNFFTVISVETGESITCIGCGIEFQVRLAGIDIPDRSSKGSQIRTPTEEARKYLVRNILRKQIEIEQLGLDEDNRLLGIIYFNGHNINLDMIEKGYARVYEGDHRLDLRPYRAAEKLAKIYKWNIWSKREASNLKDPRDSNMQIIQLYAPPVIFIVVSLILTHFFNDSDKHRGLCAKLRAKYLLTNRGPREYLENKSQDKFKLEAECIEDFLQFRAIQFHFGIINGVIILGKAYIIAILFYIVITYCKQCEFSIIIILSLLIIGCFVLQYTYGEQQSATGRRIRLIEKEELGAGGTLREQCNEILKEYKQPQFEELTNCLYKISKFTMNRYGDKPRPERTFLICFGIDALAALIILSPKIFSWLF